MILFEAYVDFVNNVVIEGFVSAIAVSLQYLCEILDPLIIARHEMLPLFDAWMQEGKGQKLWPCSRMCTWCTWCTCLVADEVKWNETKLLKWIWNTCEWINFDRSWYCDCQGKLMSDGKTSRTSSRTIPMKVSWSHVPRWRAEDVKIELQGTEIVFDPPFEAGHQTVTSTGCNGKDSSHSSHSSHSTWLDMFWTDWDYVAVGVHGNLNWFGTCSLLYFSGELEVKREWWRYLVMHGSAGWRQSQSDHTEKYHRQLVERLLRDGNGHGTVIARSNKYDTTWWYKKRHVIDIGEQHHVVHTNRALTDGNHAFALMTSKICSGKCGNDSMTRLWQSRTLCAALPGTAHVGPGPFGFQCRRLLERDQGCKTCRFSHDLTWLYWKAIRYDHIRSRWWRCNRIILYLLFIFCFGAGLMLSYSFWLQEHFQMQCLLSLVSELTLGWSSDHTSVVFCLWSHAVKKMQQNTDAWCVQYFL